MRNAWHALPYGRTLPASLEPSVEVAQFALTARDLFALARNPDVESRLVFAPDEEALRLGRTSKRAASDTAGWRLRQGPFNRLPSRRQRGWSLLVQGVDLHVPAARALMDRFRFLPDARLDDLMLSFASDGGGVGPHVDSYDVFLLQIQGRRRWAISAPAPATLVPDAPLRILADFRAEQTWVLEPGDMLYLPPGWGHEGTAIGECMTCSIGFRSPSITELRQAFFSYLADRQPPLPNSPPGRQTGIVTGPARRSDILPRSPTTWQGPWATGCTGIGPPGTWSSTSSAAT
jgi:50S ribosomal protein L16 3-hydroxylase